MNTPIPTASPATTPSGDTRQHLLTVAEAACELRCSKAHVHHLIAGQVRGVRPLPSLWLGRRRLILRASFEEWLRTTEHNPGVL
jgi:excisionase family DNA binding protein